jgi:hypothetical protein
MNKIDINSGIVHIVQNINNIDRYIIYENKEIKDSKKLSPKKREQLAKYIKEVSITYGIGTASNDEIDTMNILNATMKAMHRAVDEAYKKHCFNKILVDGPHFKGYIPSGDDSDIIDSVKEDDLFVFLSGRKQTVSYDFHIDNIPKTLNKNNEFTSFIVFYPETLKSLSDSQISEMTVPAIQENIEKVIYLKDKIKDILKGDK